MAASRSLRRVWILLGVLGLLGALAGALIVRTIEQALSPARVEALLGQELGLAVEVEAVELHWVPPGIAVRDARAGPALQVSEARIEPVLAELLGGRVRVGELHLRDARAELLLREDGVLAFATGAPGGVPLPASGDGDLDRLPDVHLRQIRVRLHGPAEAREPLELTLDRLTVDRVPVVGNLRIRGEGRLGPQGRQGTLRVRAGTSALQKLGRDAEQEPTLHLDLEARGLATLALGPWLPGAWRLAIAASPVDLQLELEGRRTQGFDGELRLDAGALHVGPLEVGAPAWAQGRAVVVPAGLRLESGSFRMARAATGWARARELRGSLAWTDDALRVESLDLEDLELGEEAGRTAEASGLVLRVDHAGELQLRGLRLGDEPLVPHRIEARDLQVRVETAVDGRGGGAEALPLRVERLTVADLVPGGTARLELRAQGGAGSEQARLRVQGRYGPWRPELSPLAQPLALEIEAEGFDAARLAPLLPEAWGVSAEAPTPLSARARLEGPRLADLGGPVTLTASRGRLELAEMALEAPARLEGELRLAGAGQGGSGPSLMHAHAEAAGAALGPGRSGAVSGAFAWQQGRLRIERLRVEALHFPDGLRLGAPPGEGTALDVRRAARLSLQGLELPPSPEAGPFPLPEQIEARECDVALELGLRAGAPPVAIHIQTLGAQGLARGGRAEVHLHGTLGEASGGGLLTGRTVLEPFAADRPFGPQIRELMVALAEADAGKLAGQLPEGVAPDHAEGNLDVSLQLDPSPGLAKVGAKGRLAARLEGGAMQIEGLRFPAPARLEGAVSLSSDGVPKLGGTLLAVAGGRWRQTGELVLSDPPRLDARFSVEDVALYKIVEFESEASRAPGIDPPVSPRLAAELSAAGPLGEGERRFHALRGEGRMHLRGGELPSSELVRTVGRALARQVGLAAGNGRVRRTPLDEASARFALREGRLVSEDLTVSTSEYTLRGSGYVTTRGQIDFSTEVTFKPSGVSSLLRILDFAGPLTGNVVSLPPVPVSIEGTLAEPRFRADPARIPVAWVRMILGIPGRALDAVTGAGRFLGRGLSDLLGGGDESPLESPAPGDAAPDSATEDGTQAGDPPRSDPGGAGGGGQPDPDPDAPAAP